jgi:hypothetical protein
MELEEACVLFWKDFEEEASQYVDEMRYTILDNMAKEYEELLGVPYPVLGLFVMRMH